MTVAAAHAQRASWLRVLLLAALCALATAIAVLSPVRHPHLGAQAARYVVLAESLTHGSYRLTSSPVSETEVSVPPVWPAVLAVAHVLAGPASPADFVPVAEGITLALFLGLLVAVFHFVEPRSGPLAATVVTLLTASQPWLVPFGRTPMTEVPFTLLLVAALGVGSAALRRRDGGLLGVALGLALLSAWMRPAGAAAVLALAWRGWHVFPTRRRALVVFSVATLLWPIREVAALLVGTPTAATTSGEFLNGLDGRSPALAIAENARFYASALVAAVFPTDLLDRSPMEATLRAALWVVIALGAVRDSARDRGLAATACGLFAIGLLVWPVHTTRYVVPLLPLALHFAARGVGACVELAGFAFGTPVRPRGVRLAPILLLALLVPYLRWDLAGRSSEQAAEGWVGFNRTLAWVEDTAPHDAVLLTRYAEEAFLRTGRQAMPLDRALRPSAAASLREEPLWLVRDVMEPGLRGGVGAVEISRAGGRIRYVETDTGTEVWVLPARALQQLRGRPHA